ncbi:MAG TPA: PBP1A family penicillin-binding protein, partial [Spirochaetia bacterium]|nr:PBP1A family penicillin-binding protein [Spirochaetia bacterium]
HIPRPRSLFEILLIAAFAVALLLGISLGLALAATRNISVKEQFGDHKPALPTRILDIHDREITEFFGDQNRELVTIDQVPQHLIDALLTREDRNFFSHHGFSLRGLLRALFNIVTGQYVSGASTLTQQLAGRLYADRSDISIRRKLVELWWAIQMERRYTKQEILLMYLNEMPFGHNTQGVQAASKFFFKHPVQEDTLAESVMLVIQLAKPGLYSPIKNPQRARRLQRQILDQMVGLGYVTKQEADSSFDDYWAKYDYTRPNTTAYFEREDKAPYFSEYIRNQLDELLFGSYDILTDGLVVHTTLNLDDQKLAEDRMKQDIEDVNNRYLALAKNRIAFSNAQFLPMVDMLGLTFNIDDLMYRNRNAAGNAKRLYAKSVNPVVELATSLFSMQRPQDIVAAGNEADLNVTRRTQVQGALVSIDPHTGYILAMVGGKEFGVDQFNRASQAKVEPGSAFKPLYYSAAIDSRKFTPATMILDAPVVFTNPDGTLYQPLNYKGQWHGRVLLRDALAESMNVPSLKVLDGIGFDAAIQRASRMLGITDPAEIEKTFPRYYPLGLGIVTVSPLQMARAFSVFANGGREVVPVAIRYIEDRNGKIILEPAKEVMAQEARKGDAAQIMSPQTAYIMTSMLQSTIKEGTLGGVASMLDIWNDKGQPFAAKTGTTQNWSDAWTVGFSPYMTTAVWYGFDQGNRSLGTELTGAAIAGPTWAKYMKEVHKNLPVRLFDRPETGLVSVEVSATSGLLPTAYTKKTIKEIFLAGTEPKAFDEIDEYNASRAETIEENLRKSLINTAIGSGDNGIAPIDVPAPDASTPPAGKGNPLLD